LNETTIRKRLVERLRYMRRVNTQWKWIASTGFVWCVALFSLLLMPVLAVVALVLWIVPVVVRHDWELLIAGVLVIGGLFVACFHVTKSLLTETRSFLPVHPDTYRNAHLLPAEETLMRASDLPEEQQQQLLRPVALLEMPPDQLLRAHPSDAPARTTYALRHRRQNQAGYDGSARFEAVITAVSGGAVPNMPGKAPYHEPDQRRRSPGDPEESERSAGE
jgi:hypothetical protein